MTARPSVTAAAARRLADFHRRRDMTARVCLASIAARPPAASFGDAA
jgi:hypothetical protein